MRTFLLAFYVFSLSAYSQVTTGYVPGKMVNLICAVTTDDGVSPGAFHVEVFNNGAMVNGTQENQNGQIVFNFCSNMITDSTIIIQAIRSYPEYYFGTLTAKFSSGKTYHLIASHLPEKDRDPRNVSRCGTDSYNQSLLQHKHDYEHRVFYRHCDGTVLSYRELVDMNKPLNEWVRLQ